MHGTSFVLPLRADVHQAPSSSSVLGDEPVEYIVFEDDSGEVARMALVRPASTPLSSQSQPFSEQAPPTMTAARLRTQAEREMTLTRPIDVEMIAAIGAKAKSDETSGNIGQSEANVDEWSEPKTLARRLFGSPPSIHEPVTLTRPLAIDAKNLDHTLDTLPCEKKLMADNTAATLLRHDAVLPPPLASSSVQRSDLSVVTRTHVLDGMTLTRMRTPATPWAPPPQIDSSPPPEPATRTPLVMIATLESTRVAPMLAPNALPRDYAAAATPPSSRPPLNPIPFPQYVASSGGQIPRVIFGVASTLLVAALVVIVARPHHRPAASATAAAPPRPVLVAPLELPPPSVAPPVASPPPLVAAMTPPPPPTMTAPATTPRDRRRPAARPVSRPGIPPRREQ